MANETSQQQQQLTSTTAPGKFFTSRSELANHYKSDWHKYNIKRREMQMTMLTYEEFNARLEAALALKKERELMEDRSGKDHLKNKTRDRKKKKKGRDKKNGSGGNNEGGVEQQRKLSKRKMRQEERKGVMVGEATNMTMEEEKHKEEEEEEEEDAVVEDQTLTEEAPAVVEQPPVIDPKQSLFDSHISSTVEENIDYMYQTYGFFLPDIEYLADKEGLIGYCAEKIKLGHTCLYCQKTFTSWSGCQKHMIQTRHTKLRYEAGIDLEEFDVFYDFTDADVDFLNSGIGNYKKKKKTKNMKREENDFGDSALESKLEKMNIQEDYNDEEVDDDDESGEWEDIGSDEEMDDDEESEDNNPGLYAAYQDEIAQHGLDITPLGELIFPDGRIIGHRGLSRYYKQRITLEDSRTAVVAARRANGERLYEGRVYDMYSNNDANRNHPGTLALARAGLTSGLVQGRQGNGILVQQGGGAGGRASYTALSLYRYKASVKKARREEFKARRLQQRTTLPMNKMDKKANRLHNNVSVSHAPR